MTCCGQTFKISGVITDSLTHKPVANVSVYIGNTSIGTTTNESGLYIFNSLGPGTHTIIASSIGYQPKQVQVFLRENETLDIPLKTQTVELKEVVISSNSDRAKSLNLFKKRFIGESEYSELCKITNEDILKLSFNGGSLKASTKDFLIIENRALGYKLRFLINEYTFDTRSNNYHYSGSVFFEELNGSEKEKKTWNKNRKEVYNGSFKEFLSALSQQRVSEDGFVVKRFFREANPKRPPDSILIKKLEYFKTLKRTKAIEDSFAYVKKIFLLPKIIERADKGELMGSDITKLSFKPGISDLNFQGYLYVIYKKKRVDDSFENLFRAPGSSNFQISIVKNRDQGDPVEFDKNGIQLTKGSLFFEGAWADASVAKLLPNDYVP